MKCLTSAAAGVAAEHTAPAYFFSGAAGGQLGICDCKTPCPGLGFSWGIAAVAKGWLLLACLLSRVSLGARLLREAPSAPLRERCLTRAILRHFAAAWAWKCGSNRKAVISLMLSISTALSAVIGAGAAQKNVYNAKRAKKDGKFPTQSYSKISSGSFLIIPCVIYC